MDEEGGGQQPAITSRRVRTHRTRSSWPGGGEDKPAVAAVVVKTAQQQLLSHAAAVVPVLLNPVPHTGLDVTADRARRHPTPSPTLDCTSLQTERDVTQPRHPHWTARLCRQNETSLNPVTHTGLHVTADRARRHQTPSPTADCTSPQTERDVTKPRHPQRTARHRRQRETSPNPRHPHWTARHCKHSETSPNPVTHTGLHVSADRARRHPTPSPTLDCMSLQTERDVTADRARRHCRDRARRHHSPIFLNPVPHTGLHVTAESERDVTADTEQDVTKPRPPHWTARHCRRDVIAETKKGVTAKTEQEVTAEAERDVT